MSEWSIAYRMTDGTVLPLKAGPMPREEAARSAAETDGDVKSGLEYVRTGVPGLKVRNDCLAGVEISLAGGA